MAEDSAALLDLLASLTDRDSKKMQIEINTYLLEATSARICFLMRVFRDEEIVEVDVLGEKILHPGFRVSIGRNSFFMKPLTRKERVTLDDLEPNEKENFIHVLKMLQSTQRIGAPIVSASKPVASLPSTSNPAGKGNAAVRLSTSSEQIPSPVTLLTTEVLTCDISTEDCLSNFVEPLSFLCIPLQDTIKDRRLKSETASVQSQILPKSDTSINLQSDCPAILVCLVDKLPNKNFGRKRRKIDSISSELSESRESSNDPVSQDDSLDFRNEDCFHERDVNCVQETFKYVLSMLLTTLDYEDELRLRTQSQKMLSVAQKLFARLGNVPSLLQEIMSEARALTNAERCSLFLLDSEKKELYAKVFDGQTSDGENDRGVRMPADKGIAGHVCTNGTLLNIKDAYSHPLFYPGFDEKTGFRTKSLLCFPILAVDESASTKETPGNTAPLEATSKKLEMKPVIGVAELCNKTDGAYFNQFDEQVAASFSVFCGIAITHSLLYRKIVKAHDRIILSNDLVMHHMNVTKDEVENLTKEIVPTPSSLHQDDFFSFRFFPRVLEDNSTPLAVISMFHHIDFGKKWEICPKTLARFVLMVRKGYRDPPYHNWVHAFSVTHFAFLLITNLKLVENGILDSLEALALMVSCMCHDLDHRGTTNTFQLDSNSVLASLYSSGGSVMERHHLAQAMCIINADGCNIFETLTKEEYLRCLDLMRNIILATDLAHHLRLLEELKEMAKDGFDPKNKRHRHLCLCLLVTSADLSDQTKDWHASRSVAKLIYTEFFTQGDLEKAMGNRPIVVMDRDKAFIPELQLSFLDGIALPVYQLVSEMFPEARAPYQSVLDSHKRWSAVKDKYKVKSKSYTSSLDIFDEDLNSV